MGPTHTYVHRRGAERFRTSVWRKAAQPVRKAELDGTPAHAGSLGGGCWLSASMHFLRHVHRRHLTWGHQLGDWRHTITVHCVCARALSRNFWSCGELFCVPCGSVLTQTLL